MTHYSRMPVPKTQRGFTLLEVLIALTVFAITAAAMINGIAGSLAAQSHLERKAIAHWVAMNQLAETRLLSTWPAVGISDGSEEMAGHEWFWSRKIEETSDPKLRRVDIEVRAEREEESPLTRLAGFVTDRPALLAAPTGEVSGDRGGGGDGTTADPDKGASNNPDDLPPEPPDDPVDPGGDK